MEKIEEMMEDLVLHFIEECEKEQTPKSEVKKIITAIQTGNIHKLCGGTGDGLFILWDMLGCIPDKNPLENAIYTYATYLWSKSVSTGR